MSNQRTFLPVFAGGKAIACVLNRRTALVLCCLLFSALISSCGFSDSNESATAPRASGVVNTAETLAPISVPPGTGDRPLLPGQSGTQYMPNGLPALAPSRGVNADTMFADKVSGDDARFKRLENAVADMRREFDAIKPAIIRLSAVEGDMQNLITQLQGLAGQTQMPAAPVVPVDPNTINPNVSELGDVSGATQPLNPQQTNDLTQPIAPVVAAPEVMPSPPVVAPLQPEPATPTVQPVAPVAAATSPPAAQTATSPPANDSSPAVSGIRSGVFEGLARLVLDVSGSGAYTLDVDNVDHVLTIALGDAVWGASLNGSFAKSPLLSSWSAETSASGKGSVVMIQLSGNATIVKQSVLPGANGQGKRIVIDIRKTP